MRTDAQLVAATLDGEHDAFGELVTRHQGSLFRFLLQYVGNAHDAEELAQDSFLRAFSKLHRYNQRYAFSTWLYAIARRLALSFLRRRRPAAPLEWETPSPGVTPAEAAAHRDAAQQVWLIARRTLGDTPFLAIWLRYQEDMGIREIARILGRSETHVKVILHRGRKQLASSMRRTDHVVLDRTMANVPVG